MSSSEMYGEQDFDLAWDGRRCKIRPLAAKPSQTIALKLVNLLGAGMKEAGLAGSVEAAELITIGAVFERLDQSAIDLMTREFSKVTAIESAAGTDKWVSPGEVQDLCFGGGPGLARWMRWLAFCLEMSCKDFFSDLRARSAAARSTQTPQANPSPST